MTVADLIPSLTFLLTVLAMLGGTLKYVHETGKANAKALEDAKATLRELMEKGDAAVKQEASKWRHELAHGVQALQAESRRDLAETKREAASKADMQSMEARWNNTTARLEGKMDRLSEKMDHVQALEAQMKLALEQLGAIGKRLDGREGRAA